MEQVPLITNIDHKKYAVISKDNVSYNLHALEKSWTEAVDRNKYP